MTGQELQFAIKTASQIETEVSELYTDFANSFEQGTRERQFWMLLTLEERTHSQMLDLMWRSVDPRFSLEGDAVPAPLRNNMSGLTMFRDQVRDFRKTFKKTAADGMWMLKAAAVLEQTEADQVVDWLLQLPVADNTRKIIDNMTANTHDHGDRVRDAGTGLFRT